MADLNIDFDPDIYPQGPRKDYDIAFRHYKRMRSIFEAKTFDLKVHINRYHEGFICDKINAANHASYPICRDLQVEYEKARMQLKQARAGLQDAEKYLKSGFEEQSDALHDCGFPRKVANKIANMNWPQPKSYTVYVPHFELRLLP